MAQHRNTPSSVYFIQGVSTQLIKIGVSNRVQARLIQLQQGSADRLLLLGVVVFRDPKEAFGIERRLHLRFAPNRAYGEWFRPDASLTKFLRSITRERLRRLVGGWHFDAFTSDTLAAEAIDPWRRGLAAIKANRRHRR